MFRLRAGGWWPGREPGEPASGLWPATRHWSLVPFGQIVYTPEEETAGTGHSSYAIGWRWMVKLVISSHDWHKQGPSLVDYPELAFYIDYQSHRPANDDPPPRSVVVLVQHLRRLTGIDTVARGELGRDERGFFGCTTTTTIASEPEVTRGIYRTLDEVPEHLRDQAREMLNQSRDGEPDVRRSVHITVRDIDENERVYKSLDEMPSEVRDRYADSIRRARKRK